MSGGQLEGAQAARAAMMAADVIHQMSLRMSELEEALENCSGVQAAAEVTERCAEVLQEQLNDALRREREVRAENDAAAARLLQAQELCSRLFKEAENHQAAAERHQAAAVAAAARAAVADERVAQAHRAADAAVESARAEAVRQSAALEEERRLRTAAQAEAEALRGEKRHLEELMERLAAVVSTLTKRCAAFMETGAPPAAPPGGGRLPRRQQQGAVSHSGMHTNSTDTPSSLASLTAVLKAAERELSALDERLGSPAVTADEQAQLRAAMQRTGARIRKIAAARASLLGVKS